MLEINLILRKTPKYWKLFSNKLYETAEVKKSSFFLFSTMHKGNHNFSNFFSPFLFHTWNLFSTVLFSLFLVTTLHVMSLLWVKKLRLGEKNLLQFVPEVRTGKSSPCSVPAWFYLQLLAGSYLPTIVVEIKNPWVLAASPVSLMWSSLKMSLIFSTHIFTAASAVLYKHDTDPPILTVEQSTPFGFYKSKLENPFGFYKGILAYSALSVLQFL